jgi:hypothetical protein
LSSPIRAGGAPKIVPEREFVQNVPLTPATFAVAPANMRRGPERQASTDRPPGGFLGADCGHGAVIPRSNQKVNAGRRQSEIKIQEWEAVRAELKQKTIHAKNVWRHANKSFSNKKPD